MSQKPENRVNLFRLQILIIDGGLLVLRNLIDQTLTAQGITLSACLNQGRSTITRLKSRGVITQEQYDILFPTSGHVPTTSEMDLTLIIFLLRCLRCFGLNTNFDWKATPIPTDLSIEADICRLKAHRNDISHKPQTTDIEAHDFVTLWKDIEQILVRHSSPALNIQQTIDGFKTCSLDTEGAKKVQEEIQKWKDYEADVDRLKEEMIDVKERVTKVEKTQEEIKRRLEEVIVYAKWILKSADDFKRIPDTFDKNFIAMVKGQECFRDEYKVFQEKVRDLLFHIEQTTGAKAIDAETSCVIVKFICRTNKHIKNLLEYFDSDDLKYRLNEITKLISLHAKIQVNLSFRISDESLDSIIQTEAGTELDSHISLTEDTYLIRKEELKEDLIIFNKCSHSIILLPPLFEKDYTPLASFYIRPELDVNTLQDMFQTGGVANREIYLKADAGLGKTTFSKYLATSWCQAHCPDKKDVLFFEKNDIDCMRDFDFVFLVLLRDSNTSCSVDELIFKLIVSNLANSKSFTKELMQSLLSREKCLVILDGLDEWTHPNTQCERGPRSIPHRNFVRENSTILTTTRPWKLEDLNLSSNELGRTVELSKLSCDAAGTLVTRTVLRLKSPPHKKSLEILVPTLVNEIFKKESRVAHLAYAPLLLMYMSCLRCEGFNIGNSKCELYVKIVELLLLRTTQKYGDISQTLSSSDVPACFTEHDKCKEYFPLLMNLGQLAHHTLSNETRENTLVFDGSVTEECLTPDEMKFALHSGILSQSTARTLIKKVSKVSFSHKTVQEFFAAIFISSEKEVQTIVLEICRSVQDILEMSNIFEFIIEMNADRMFAMTDDLMSVINEDQITRDYRTRTGNENMYDNPPLYNIQKMFMLCLQKMPERENIQLCLQDFFIVKKADHSEQLQRLLKQNKTNIKSLYIDTEDTSSSSLRDIIDLFSLTNLSHIQKLYYHGNLKETEISRILFPSLQAVCMSFCKWRKDEENLSENLARVQNLQYLHIKYFTLSHKILETFFNFISSQKSMKELTLHGLVCKEDGNHYCKRLNLDLSQHSTLSKLHLWELPGWLQLNISTPSLVNVTLQKINLDESSLLLSRDMLNIKRVQLRWIEMSVGSLQSFITVLENLPQSVTVQMYDIKPKTEYDRVRENIRSSQTFHVIAKDFWWMIEFKTIKPSKE